MLKQQLQQATSVNGKARLYAIENTVELSNLIPPTVNYESHGNLLIVGPTAIIQSTAEQLHQMTSVTLLSTDGEEASKPLSHTSNLYFTSSIEIQGFLGSFLVSVSQESGEQQSLSLAVINQPHFDVVLDMTLTGCMTEEVPVPGYYPVGRGTVDLAEALNDIPTLIGTFDKPKYFRLNNELCAHSSRGVKGCERCVDSCPAGALSSVGSDKIGHHIEVNPFLCQGVGTCATTCPTEAISYALPEPRQTQQFIERTLANYLSADGQNPIVLFCSSRHEKYNIMALRALPDNVIPIVIEELPSVGIDTWFTALTHGATQVLFAASKHMPETIIRVLTQEVTTAQQLLQNIGLAPQVIDILYLENLRYERPVLCTEPLLQHQIEVTGNKRERLFTALDALATQFPIQKLKQPLPSNATFGTVHCDSSSCTSCMACIAVCPTAAIHNDGQSPQLHFIEQDCIQCGMCSKACPESALTLESRFNWNANERKEAVMLHQDSAAQCLSCGKPFAPQSLISMLQNKLKGHSHFSDDTAIRRVAMCEDCRVKDIFNELAEKPEQQLNY